MVVDQDRALDVTAIVGRLAAAIQVAAVDRLPSDNIFMEDVFPKAVYAEMLARLPSDEALDFIDHPHAVTPDGRKTRMLLDLTQDTLDRFDPADRPFWSAMTEVFTSPVLLAALVEKFRTTLNARYNGDIPDMIVTPIFYRDFPGYRIGIHPDAAIKLATLQFYLPANNDQIHLGTTFHARTAEGFVDLKTNPFKPNSAYGFVRTEESWHSVYELGPHEDIRNTIALTVYERGLEYRSTRRTM